MKIVDLNWCSNRAWLKFSLVMSFCLIGLILLFWSSWTTELKLLAATAALIPIHATEEWVFPGGFAFQYNQFLYASSSPDRYPMNRASDMVTVLGTTLLYLLLTLISLMTGQAATGILMSVAGFALLEVGVHTYLGIRAYLRYRAQGKTTIYSVGSLSAYAGFGPLAVLAIMTCLQRGIQWTDWIWALAILMGIALLCVLPEKIFQDKNSPYVFGWAHYYTRFEDK